MLEKIQKIDDRLDKIENNMCRKKVTTISKIAISVFFLAFAESLQLKKEESQTWVNYFTNPKLSPRQESSISFYWFPLSQFVELAKLLESNNVSDHLKIDLKNIDLLLTKVNKKICTFDLVNLYEIDYLELGSEGGIVSKKSKIIQYESFRRVYLEYLEI